MKTVLVLRALTMALMRRGWPTGATFHSDRGSQYCSRPFRRKLKVYDLRQSMSRQGNCWDNAPSESFFSTLKSELNGSRAFGSRSEAQAMIFEYIEVFYNRVRLHSSIGYVPPTEYEEDMVEKAV
jgi:transposase InsO family protein